MGVKIIKKNQRRGKLEISREFSPGETREDEIRDDPHIEISTWQCYRTRDAKKIIKRKRKREKENKRENSAEMVYQVAVKHTLNTAF